MTWKDPRANYARFLIHNMTGDQMKAYQDWYATNIRRHRDEPMHIADLDSDQFDLVLDYLVSAWGLSDTEAIAVYVLVNNE